MHDSCCSPSRGSSEGAAAAHVAARQGSSTDSSTGNVGFRCARDG